MLAMAYTPIGIDDTADEAAEYGIVAGEYPNDTFAYRSECTGGTPLSPEPASCAGDGVEMTFKYSAEAFARVQLPDSLGVHEASASAGGGVTAFIADFGYSIYDWFSGFETNNFLVGGAGANVSLSGFDRQESDYQKVSGFITVNVSAGEAVYTRQTGYANGRAYLASPPTPVPVPASFVLLCGGIAALFPLAGLRRRPPA